MKTRQTPVDVALPRYGIYLLESHHAPEFRIVEPSHPFLELFFVMSGSGTFRIGLGEEGVSLAAAFEDAGFDAVGPVGLSQEVR